MSDLLLLAWQISVSLICDQGAAFAVNRAEAYTYLDYKDFDYEQGRFFEASL